MKTIIVGFSKSKKKFPVASWLIRLYQLSEYSHVYIRLQMNKGSIFPSDKILHASEGKIQNMSGTQFDKRHEVIEEFEIEVSANMYKQILIQLHEASGDDYSVLQNVGIFLVDFVRIFGFVIKNPWVTGWNCSEFVASILIHIFPSDFKHLDPNTCTPKNIYNILKRLLN